MTPLETLPIEITRSDRAVVWNRETRDGKPTKVPYNPRRPADRARVDDPSTWAPFSDAVAAVEDGKCDGPGVVLGAGLIGVDLDACRDPTTGVITPAARAIVAALNSYTEISPSGCGVHILATGTLPPGRRRHGRIEMYADGRFFTVTGHHLAGTPTTIEERTAALAALHARVFPVDDPAHPSRPAPALAKTIDDDDATLIARMQAAKNGGKVSSLWAGDSSGYPSASEADLALASALAFWTGRDASRMDRLFRQSGLMREKWDTLHGRDTYGNLTIDRAIAGCHDTYQGTRPTPIADEPPAAPTPSRPPIDPDWPQPLPIASGLPAVEAFCDELLPTSFRSLARDVAERMQVPLDYPAVTLVVSLAGVVSRRAVIQPKQHDTGWIVVPNLWGAIVAPPGFLKSPVIHATTAPLVEIQREWLHEYDNARREHAQELEECELKLAAWKEQYKANMKGGKPKPTRPADAPDEPRLRRLIVNDATFEALHQTMADNPAGILAIRDELTGWWSQLDRPGREGERAFCLQAWNGDTGHTIDRIGRGTIHVDACCMSLLGGIQPARLRSYLVDALVDGPANDGLIQRFQLLVWPDTPPAWSYVDRPPHATSIEEADAVFRRLLTERDAGNPVRFRFTPPAHALFVDFLTDLESRVRGATMHPALVSHISKYRSLMPSLALLFELTECAAETDVVSLEHARQAVAWCAYLESHARRIYSCVVSPQTRAARELADHLTKEHLGRSFSCRDVQRRGWSGLDTIDLVRLAVDALVDADWLREVPGEPSSTGGRPSMRYDVNPRIWS